MTTKQQKRVYPQEILNAEPEKLIAWFDDLGTHDPEHGVPQHYRFLSNFYKGEKFTVTGVTWLAALEATHPSLPDLVKEAYLEHYDLHDDVAGLKGKPQRYNDLIEWTNNEQFFAAMKAWGSDFDAFVKMAQATDPGVVKSLGRRCKLRSDWEVVKLDVMMAGLRAKFADGREEADLLVGTGDALLVEGTWWDDDVWGVALTDGKVSALESPGRNWLGTMLMARRAELRAEVQHDTGLYNAVFATSADHRAAWAK